MKQCIAQDLQQLEYQSAEMNDNKDVIESADSVLKDLQAWRNAKPVYQKYEPPSQNKEEEVKNEVYNEAWFNNDNYDELEDLQKEKQYVNELEKYEIRRVVGGINEIKNNNQRGYIYYKL